MKKILPFLWFDDNAEEAARFYEAVIPDTSITNIQYYDKVNGGKVMTVQVKIGDTTYTLLNGGPHYALTPAFSLLVNCESQQQIDEIWDKLSDGGKPMQCGWISDKFGLTWQIVPKELFSLMNLEDRDVAQKVMSAMFEMVKIDLPTLQAIAGEAK